ncbi:MAG: AMP-binding protein [Actinobacteria bacterium]|nr:AMP-binding protein [Actinomycetota bacterium]
MDVAYLLRRGAREHAARPAVVWGDRHVTYGALDERAQRLANGLRACGIEPGDAVGVLLDNRIEYPEVDVALAYGGFVRVALNARLGSAEFAYSLGDVGARAIVTEAAFDETVAGLVDDVEMAWIRIGDAADGDARALDYEDLVERSSPRVERAPIDDGSTAWVSYTSGTTGRPKGVTLSHRALAQVTFNMMMELGPITSGRSILLPQPLSHGAGFFVLAYLATGGRCHVLSRFDADHALALGASEGIDTLKLVPSMLADLVTADGSSAFDTIIYGASPIPASVLDRALDRFGPVLMQIYGQSEAPVTITVLHKADHARPGEHRRSAGRPWRSVQLAVVDDDGTEVAPGELGELVVAGAHLMDGYHGKPELTAEVLRDGRLWTRDMAIIDPEGYVHLRGRRDDMINSGGFNIAPKEVEDAVAEHPAVAECVAVGYPHPRWGEAVRVYVVTDGGAVTEAEIIEHSRPRLGFRRPRSVVFVDSLPRSSYGKVDRSRLPVPTGASDGQRGDR